MSLIIKEFFNEIEIFWQELRNNLFFASLKLKLLLSKDSTGVWSQVYRFFVASFFTNVLT